MKINYDSRKAKKWENAVKRLLRVAKKHYFTTWSLTEFMEVKKTNRVQKKERNRVHFLELAIKKGDYSQI